MKVRLGNVLFSSLSKIFDKSIELSQYLIIHLAVGFVVGPRSEIYPQSIILGFHTIMFNILFRKSEPDDACDAAYKATGKKFIVHDAQQYLAEDQLGLAA